MNSVTTDVDNTPTPSTDDWQADLFGVIPSPASAHAAWTDDCSDDIDMCTDPTVLKAIAPAQSRWASPSCKASARRKPDANHACIYQCGGLLSDSASHYWRLSSCTR
eukprot:1588150-Pleurochrysis_carterae.AAC.1